MITVVQSMKLRAFPNDQSNSRAWLERFERMRAAGGFRPTSIHADMADIVRACELPADALLLVAANDE